MTSSPQIFAQGWQSIAVGSKSFAWASRFLSPQTRGPARALYMFCRYADDLVDEAASTQAALEHLRELKVTVHNLRHQTAAHPTPALEALRWLFLNTHLQEAIVLDLLEGFEMDLVGYFGRDQKNLERYCYCVAGAVGIMMCQVMGIQDPKALPHADALGRAMQLTNISRDFTTDWSLNRVYVPMELLHDVQVAPADFAGARQHWPFFASELLKQADRCYKIGREGYTYLPWRERLAVAIAARVYQGIGVKILKRGPQAWTTRTYTSPWEKLVCSLKGIWDCLV